MRLFTIAASVSQGFMSGAAARTDLCYSTMIAKVLGREPGVDYLFPTWPEGGLPYNLEAVLRRLNQLYGSDIRGIEWAAALFTINAVIDRAEDYYERGDGRADAKYKDPGNPVKDIEFFHNVSARGFDVADAWLVTSELCQQQIQDAAPEGGGDGFLAGPNASFYRTALKVLNPSLDPQHNDKSQIDWLKFHAAKEGVENLILWLGSNNALETVLDLDIRPTPNDPKRRPVDLTHEERSEAGWNLWRPDDFAAEYKVLLEKVHEAMQNNHEEDWRVFVGTVPAVTIAPLAKGVGGEIKTEHGTYFKYYTYVPFEEEFAKETGIHLTAQDAMRIDAWIRRYNDFIRRAVAEKNDQLGKRHYIVVDLADALLKLAWKRNDGNPTYKLPAYFDDVYPPVNTKYYHADADGRLKQGGIFSLDGVHPSAIGQGLVAHEFLKAMKQAGVVGADPDKLDWPAIFASDSLYSKPISLMQEIYQHEDLAIFLVKIMRFLKKKPGSLAPWIPPRRPRGRRGGRGAVRRRNAHS